MKGARSSSKASRAEQDRRLDAIGSPLSTGSFRLSIMPQGAPPAVRSIVHGATRGPLTWYPRHVARKRRRRPLRRSRRRPASAPAPVARGAARHPQRHPRRRTQRSRPPAIRWEGDESHGIAPPNARRPRGRPRRSRAMRARAASKGGRPFPRRGRHVDARRLRRDAAPPETGEAAPRAPGARGEGAEGGRRRQGCGRERKRRGGRAPRCGGRDRRAGRGFPAARRCGIRSAAVRTKPGDRRAAARCPAARENRPEARRRRRKDGAFRGRQHRSARPPARTARRRLFGPDVPRAPEKRGGQEEVPAHPPAGKPLRRRRGAAARGHRRATAQGGHQAPAQRPPPCRHQAQLLLGRQSHPLRRDRPAPNRKGPRRMRGPFGFRLC